MQFVSIAQLHYAQLTLIGDQRIVNTRTPDAKGKFKQRWRERANTKQKEQGRKREQERKSATSQ